MAVHIKELICSFYGKMVLISYVIVRIFASSIMLSLLPAYQANELMEDTSGDPILEIDEQQDPVGDNETKLPNAHSAALVMGLILLAVVGYCIYRIVRSKCCPQNELPSSIDAKSSDPENTEESIKKEHEAYLAIYGKKKNISNVSGDISKSEKIEVIVLSPPQN